VNFETRASELSSILRIDEWEGESRKKKLAGLLMEKQRRMARGSLYYFTKYILDFPDLEIQPHWELCEFIQKNAHKGNCLILIPRGHFKSTLASVAYPLWRLLQDRNLRFLLTSFDLQNTVNWLSVIRGNLESNRRFKLLFGDWENREETWHSKAISVRGRTQIRAEESITASSISVAKVSQHYDQAVIDDLMTDKNVVSKEMIDKAWEYLSLLTPIIDPRKGSDEPGPKLVIGTRWHFDDVYGRIIADEQRRKREGEHPVWKVYVRKALNDQKEALFPARFSEKILRRIRNDQHLTAYQWSCQYMNDPVSDETAVFRLEDFGFYHSTQRVWHGKVEDMPPMFNNFATLDPSVGEYSDSDYTAIPVVAVDYQKNLHVRAALRGHWRINEIIDAMFRVHAEWRPYRFGVETVIFQKAILWAFQDACKAMGKWFPVEELTTDNRISKDARIRGFEPYVTGGKVFFQVEEGTDLTVPPTDLYHALVEREGNYQQTLADEMVRFPMGATRDMIDALAYTPQLVFPAGSPKEAPPQEGTLGALEKRLERAEHWRKKRRVELEMR
jgi:hypothetical protein